MTERRPDADSYVAVQHVAVQHAADQHEATTLEVALDNDATQLRFDSVTLQAFIRSLLPTDADADADAVTIPTGALDAPDSPARAIAFDFTGANAVVASTSLRLRAIDARLALLRRLTGKA